MFLELDKRNLCLPCEWGGVPLPCVPRTAISTSFGGGFVRGFGSFGKPSPKLGQRLGRFERLKSQNVRLAFSGPRCGRVPLFRSIEIDRPSGRPHGWREGVGRLGIARNAAYPQGQVQNCEMSCWACTGWNSCLPFSLFRFCLVSRNVRGLSSETSANSFFFTFCSE